MKVEGRDGGVAGRRRERSWWRAGTMSKRAGGMVESGVLLLLVVLTSLMPLDVDGPNDADGDEVEVASAAAVGIVTADCCDCCDCCCCCWTSADSL